MKCELCSGKGWLRGHPLGIQIACPVCVGKGYVEPTNEEYLRSATTEQLAEWLNNKIIICAVCDQQKNCEYFTNETCHLCPYHEGKNKSWEMWLKQPHKE